MAVFEVKVTAPGGHSRSRPVVAASAEVAFAEWVEEITEEQHGEVQGFVFDVRPVADPDGRYEHALRAAEIRRTNFIGGE